MKYATMQQMALVFYIKAQKPMLKLDCVTWDITVSIHSYTWDIIFIQHLFSQTHIPLLQYKHPWAVMLTPFLWNVNIVWLLLLHFSYTMLFLNLLKNIPEKDHKRTMRKFLLENSSYIYHIHRNVENRWYDNIKREIFTYDPKITSMMPMSKIILNMKQTKCRKVFQLDLW